MKKIYCVFLVNTKKNKTKKNNLKCYIYLKTIVLFIICSKCSSQYEKVFTKEESINILKK